MRVSRRVIVGGIYCLVLTAVVLYLGLIAGWKAPTTPDSEESTGFANPERSRPTQPQPAAAATTSAVVTGSHGSRGYLTTPAELAVIREKANLGIEPYNSAVRTVLAYADRKWDYKLDAHERCPNADSPSWIENEKGIPVLYAKALAYHLTGDRRYAEEVKTILERIMTEVLTIASEVDFPDAQCRLNFAWGTPELVASADLIEEFWNTQSCTGPLGTLYTDTTIGRGNCKVLFQNWLVKNPYYVISYSAEASQSNWGAAATNATAYIADYLWDRPDVLLVHRSPRQINGGREIARSPAEAYAYANQLALDRMNGYRVELESSESCDFLSGRQQDSGRPPVKSQITENGIIPDDARRKEHCNVPSYNGDYQNYPQVHLNNNIQQCELMLRRGDSSCFDNVEMSDIPEYTFIDPTGARQTTHLHPGRGSIERAINAIIIDSGTEWRHDEALEVAYRYYFLHHRLPGVDRWFEHLDRRNICSQGICFGTLTHGFAPGELPCPPPVVPPPGESEVTATSYQGMVSIAPRLTRFLDSLPLIDLEDGLTVSCSGRPATAASMQDME